MLQNPCILIVDDDCAVRRFIRACLERKQYQVLEAESVEGAIAIYEQCPEEIALVLSDIRVRGADGNELMRIIRKRKPSQRVLFVTAYPNDVEEGIWGLDTLPKPFSATELLRKVEAHSARAAAV